VEFAPQARIADIFQAVEAEQCHAGVVPVENSTGGVVPDTLDSLLETTARICGEILLPVHLAAMSHSSLDQVRTLYSHPNPLSQARMWLRDNLPSVDVKVMSSTTASAEAAAADDTGAALAPAPSAEAYGLQLLAENVEDEPSNRTRFFVLCPEPAEPTGRDKTSVVFSTSHRPGALHSAMGAFSQHGLNLTLIQSRPLRGQPWQYVFFVDLEGHQTDPGVKEALAELQEHCSFVKVLGSYPAQET
jgi:chorismate mutase/prephenate dehydratase